jgi:hypothetical protein
MVHQFKIVEVQFCGTVDSNRNIPRRQFWSFRWLEGALLPSSLAVPTDRFLNITLVFVSRLIAFEKLTSKKAVSGWIAKFSYFDPSKFALGASIMRFGVRTS